MAAEHLSARDFDERREKFETLSQVLAVHGFGRRRFVVGRDPANLMFVAVTPKQAAYFPDIGMRPAVRTGLDRPAAAQWKWQYVAGVRRHTGAFLRYDALFNAVTAPPGCDPALTRPVEALFPAKSETWVRQLPRAVPHGGWES